MAEAKGTVREPATLQRRESRTLSVNSNGIRKAVDIVAAMTGMALIILGITVQVPIVGGIRLFLRLSGVARILVRRPNSGHQVADDKSEGRLFEWK